MSRHRNPMRIGYIVSQERAPGMPDRPSRAESVDAPSLGLLSRTVVHSPVIRWTYFASLRHAQRNDVVFVRERSVEIKTFAEDYHFEDVAFKADFACSIRAARLLGAAPHAYDASSRDASGARAELAGKPLLKYKLPPHMLVLALQRDNEDLLAILFGYHDGLDQVRFASFQHPLRSSSSTTATDRLGEHIAQDPLSRAIAIGAQTSTFVIYRLKPRGQMEKEVEAPDGIREEDFKPILEERAMAVDGLITQMEFLQPPEEEASTIYLVLITFFAGRTIAHIYSWDSGRDLRQELTHRKFAMGLPLSNPLCLIPMKISTGFTLVCEQKLGICPDVRVHDITDIQDICNSDEGEGESADDPGNSAAAPLYTTWARPFRHSGFAALRKDVVYLCRDDGLIRLLEFDGSNDRFGLYNTLLGHLRVNIDSGFAVVEVDTNSNPSADVLLVGGHGSNGGVFIFIAKTDGILQESMPNWSPTQDYVVVPRHAVGSGSQALGAQDRIFACTGRGRRHGALCEIRHGFEARVIASLDTALVGYSQIFLLPDDSDGTLYILVSSPEQPQLYGLLDNSLSPVESIHEASWVPHLDGTSQTYAAAYTKQSIYIQVTKSSLRAILPSISLGSNASCQVESFDDCEVVAASIESSTSSVLCAVRGPLAYELRHVGVVKKDGKLCFWRPVSITMGEEPSCLRLQAIKGMLMAFVGTRGGKLVAYRVDEASLTRIGHFEFEDQDSICESLVLLERDTDTERGEAEFAILCGLRSGALQIMSVAADMSDAFSVTGRDTVTMGDTAVTVAPHHSSPCREGHLPGAATIVCENSFYVFSFSQDRRFNKTSLKRIWFVDQHGVGLYQRSILSTSQAECWNQLEHTNKSAGVSICITGSRLKAFRLRVSGKPRIIPWRIPLGGNPNRVIYSKRYRKLVVGLTINAVIDPTICFERPRDNARVSFPAIKIIDPDDPSSAYSPVKEEPFQVPSNLPPDRNEFAAIVGNSGEMITGMSFWSVTYGNKNWELLLVSTARPSNSSEFHGSVHLYNLSTSMGRVVAKEQHKFDVSRPVYAVSGHDHTSFVYCDGASLYYQKLETEEGKFKVGATPHPQLGSPGRCISVHGSTIIVGTSEHSVRVYRFQDGRFSFMFSDGRSRRSLDHLLHGDSLLLASDRGNNLCGLWKPAEPTISGELPSVFEARLPSLISRLHQADLQPNLRPDSRLGPSYAPILASTVDGSFYQLTILPHMDWMLLRSIQNLAERDRSISPYARPRPRSGSSIPGGSDPRERHVDGDILLRILDLGSESASFLRRLISNWDGREGDREPFMGLVRAVLGDGPTQTDPVEALLEYLKTTVHGL